MAQPCLVGCATASTGCRHASPRQHWRRGKIAVPDGVMDALERPHPLARIRIEREKRVGEKGTSTAGMRHKSRTAEPVGA